MSCNGLWSIQRTKALTVTGSWNSAFLHKPEDDRNYVRKRLTEKKVRPSDLITHRLLIKDLDKGFHIMRDKTEDYVKIMGVI